MVEKQQQPSKPQGQAIPPAGMAGLSQSEKFAEHVLKEFGTDVGGKVIKLAELQKQLIKGYFIGIDRALKTADEARLRRNQNNKDRKWDNLVEVSWKNVNLPELAQDAVHYARMGLDMMQDNHLSPVPYFNKKTGKYDITLTKGYAGIQMVAWKYAIEKPKAVTVELVYANDVFTPIKKSKDNPVESYEFKIVNAFDRGKIVGGFGYVEYEDPAQNSLIIMTEKDILKRKPEYASVEFWGGTKPKYEWVNGQKQKTGDETVEGWVEEMYLKTIKREVYGTKHIPLDPQKIDDNYQYMRMKEAKQAEIMAQAEIDDKANGEVIDVKPETEKKPELDKPAAEKPKEQPPATPATAPKPEQKPTGNQGPAY